MFVTNKFFAASKAFVWLGLIFLLVYPWGKEIYRRQAVLIPKCHSTKPGSDVFYHHIVQRGTYCPFLLYADYLSSVATQYPSLCFHLFFLVDDSLETARRSQREAIVFDSYNQFPYTSLYIKDGFRDIKDFTTRYGNVNVTTMTLSEYMNMIPLNHKWRNIPLSYLTFYARIFSVWQSGGVAMDLNYFNDRHNNLKEVDRRISAILKQHNDGINVGEYTSALNKIDREEEYQFFTIFNGLIHQFFNETRTFLTRNFPFPQITTDKGLSQNEPLLRTNRSKRDVFKPINDTNNKSETKSTVYVESINPTKEKDLKKNEYQLLSNPDVDQEKLKLTVNDAVKALHVTNSNIINGNIKTAVLNKSEIISETNNKTNTPRVVLFYDLSVFSGGIAPSQVLPEPEIGNAGKSGNDEVRLLSIESDGMFVAASSTLHPFLKHLISIPCPRKHPKFAIQDTLLTQCSGLFTKDSYCNNIYLL